MTSSTYPVITSIANEKMKHFRALAMKKHRDMEGLFIIEGLGPVQKALNYGWRMETLLFTSEVKNETATQDLITLGAAQGAALYEITGKVASYVSHRDNAQTIIGIFAQQHHTIELLEQAPAGIWLGLENIRDPGNLGTIIRTAEAAGVQGIVLIGHTCDAFSPEVIRATTGSFPAVPLVHISVADFLAWHTGYTGTTIGTHLHQKAVDYREVAVPFPALLLMGSEQAGLSAELTGICTILAKIPMQGDVESLNLAVSTGIMLYALTLKTP